MSAVSTPLHTLMLEDRGGRREADRPRAEARGFRSEVCGVPLCSFSSFPLFFSCFPSFLPLLLLRDDSEGRLLDHLPVRSRDRDIAECRRLGAELHCETGWFSQIQRRHAPAESGLDGGNAEDGHIRAPFIATAAVSGPKQNGRRRHFLFRTSKRKIMSVVPTPLHALIVEDRAADAKLIVRELERAGFDPKWKRVETEEDFVSRLEPSLDVILADNTIPCFGASRALEVLQKRSLDIPFIIISGTIGEDIAVAAMKQGAADYLLKDRLSRLGPVVNRVLEQNRQRKEHQRAADELGPAQEQLSHLLAHTPAVIYVLKIEGENVIPILVSENIERLLGVTVRESMHHKWWLSSLHPEDRDRAIGVLAEALKGDGYSMEYRLRHKDGSYHWVQDNNRVVRDATGKPKHAVGVWTDITERKRAEDRLREQADIINRAQDAVIVRDFTSDLVTVWNSGAERLYGWSASEAIGQPMSELISAESNDREALLEQLVSTGEFHGEIKHRAKDGREVIVDARVTLIRNDDGTPRSVLGINTDITEQKKLETQLLRAQRLESIGTLASGVAHDLNNILVPILMAAPILRDDPRRRNG